MDNLCIAQEVRVREAQGAARLADCFEDNVLGLQQILRYQKDNHAFVLGGIPRKGRTQMQK